MAKVLVADDDESLLNIVSDMLREEKYVVEVVRDGAAALAYMRTEQFDVVVLDWMMPKLNGLEVLKSYRETGGKSAIIMLTTRDSVEDRVAGLVHGADDYVPKPFSVKELVARIMAVLRRPPAATSNLLEKHGIVLDPANHTVTRDGANVHLQPMDFALLEFFMRHSSETFSGKAILGRVWHNDSKASEDGLRMAISRLRKALDQPGSAKTSIIETVNRVGYRLRP